MKAEPVSAKTREAMATRASWSPVSEIAWASQRERNCDSANSERYVAGFAGTSRLPSPTVTIRPFPRRSWAQSDADRHPSEEPRGCPFLGADRFHPNGPLFSRLVTTHPIDDDVENDTTRCADCRSQRCAFRGRLNQRPTPSG